MHAEQTVHWEVSAGSSIRPAARWYMLDELLAQCDTDAPMPKAVANWQAVVVVGREAW